MRHSQRSPGNSQTYYLTQVKALSLLCVLGATTSSCAEGAMLQIIYSSQAVDILIGPGLMLHCIPGRSWLQLADLANLAWTVNVLCTQQCVCRVQIDLLKSAKAC